MNEAVDYLIKIINHLHKMDQQLIDIYREIKQGKQPKTDSYP